MADTLSIMPGESISDDLSTLNDDASTISKDNSHRRLVSPRRSASIYTVNSKSSARTISLRLFSVKDIVLGSLMLLPIIPRISAARKEFLSIRRSTIPAPLLKHRKLLQDLLKLTRDEMPSHIRKAALRLISYVFEYLVQQIFSGSASAARKQFLSALSELCDDELPYEIREEGLMTFYYIVGAVTSLGRKNFALEFEDCRVIQLHAQTTTQVSLKLCAYSYLILAHSAFADHLYQPVSEAERRVICVCLSELTESPLPLPSIKAALDLLWRFESTLSCGLTFEERTDVWKSILSLSGSKDWNARLQYHSHQTEGIHQKNCHTRHEAALSECFLGLRCLWKFNLLPAWAADMSELHESKKRYIGADLFDLASSANSMIVRRRAFFTIVLFANLSHWEDMYDMSTWRNVNDQFADFCLNDPESVDRDSVVRRVQGIFQSMLEPSEKRTVTTRRELRISKHVSVIIKRDTDQLLALTDTVKKNCGPDLRFEAALENLAVFTMPGESLLIHKDQQAILYERICSYTEYEQTRDIAVQAMFALLTIQEWIKAAEIFESSFEE